MVLKRQLPSRLSKTSKPATTADDGAADSANQSENQAANQAVPSASASAQSDQQETTPAATEATAEKAKASAPVAPKEPVEPVSGTKSEEKSTDSAPNRHQTTSPEPPSSYAADDDDLSAWLPENGSSQAKAPAEEAQKAPEKTADDTPPEAPKQSAPTPEKPASTSPRKPSGLQRKANPTKEESKPEADQSTPTTEPAAEDIKAEGLTAADFPEPTPVGDTPTEAPEANAEAPLMGAADDTMPYFPGDDLVAADAPQEVNVPPSWETKKPAETQAEQAKAPAKNAAKSAPQAPDEAPEEPQKTTKSKAEPSTEPDDWDVGELVSNDLPPLGEDRQTPELKAEKSAEPAPASGLAASAKPASAGAPPPDFYAAPAPEKGTKAPLAPENKDVDADLDALAAEAGESSEGGKFKLPKMDGIPGLPPQFGGKKGAGGPPPELPSAQPSAGDKGPNQAGRNALLLLVVVAILGGGYYTVQNLTSVQEGFARATGTLSEFSEEIPTAQNGANGNILAPERVVIVGQDKAPVAQEPVVSAAVQAAPQPTQPQPPAPPAEDAGTDEFAALEEAEQSAVEPAPQPESAGTVVEFVDVAPEEAEAPVVAEGEADLPEDVSLFANLQKAILEAREEKRRRETALTDEEEAANVEVDPAQLSRVERNQRSAVLQQELEREMSQYREVLAAIQNPALRPSPNEFFEDPQKYLDLAAQNQAARSAQQQAQAPQGQNALPRAEISPDNPYNLPYLPEPEAESTPQVRQFAEFGAEAFTPQTPRVRIPQGVQPRLRASDFPKLEVLSLVPDKGVIAYHNGREGVLLIGETIEGWELVGVYNGYAEFANGQRKHVVSNN
jgi:hypothetical protein